MLAGPETLEDPVVSGLLLREGGDLAVRRTPEWSEATIHEDWAERSTDSVYNRCAPRQAHSTDRHTAHHRNNRHHQRQEQKPPH